MRLGIHVAIAHTTPQQGACLFAVLTHLADFKSLLWRHTVTYQAANAAALAAAKEAAKAGLTALHRPVKAPYT